MDIDALQILTNNILGGHPAVLVIVPKTIEGDIGILAPQYFPIKIACINTSKLLMSCKELS